MTDMGLALDALDDAVAAARDLDPQLRVEPVARALSQVRRRLRFLGSGVVVALAGGTGSGKSSLLNAIAGQEVVETGVVRPTTDRPTAWLPRQPEPALVRLLDDLRIEDRVGHDAGSPLCIVDLPDLDSVVHAHRALVDGLLPRVDLIVFVLDPQKYNDRAVHQRIAARAGIPGHLLFVVNQVDRLTEVQREAIDADLTRSLLADGVTDPVLLWTAADPDAGRPQGIEALLARLEQRVADKRLVVDKVTGDIAAVAGRLAEVTGIEPGDPDRGATGWQRGREEAAAEVAAAIVDPVIEAQAARAGARTAVATGAGALGRAVAAVRSSPVAGAVGMGTPAREVALPTGPRPSAGVTDAATTVLGRAVSTVAQDTGGATGRRLRARLTPEVLADALRTTAGRVTALSAPLTVEPRGWWRIMPLVLTLATVAVVVGAGWAWADPAGLAPGAAPWPIILVAAGLVGGVVGRAALRRSGHAAGRKAARDYRAALVGSVSEQLQRTVGEEISDALRLRRRVREGIATARQHAGR